MMKSMVIDCSVVMAWCFEDESSLYAGEILERLAQSKAVMPAVWPLEVANALVVAERRKRLTEADATRFISLLTSLPITVDVESANRVFPDIIALARRYELSSYDASYLELAMRHALPLATTDEKLKKAAQCAGVTVHGLRRE
jgi:predicted nucleic acid-binding protein